MCRVWHNTTNHNAQNNTNLRHSPILHTTLRVCARDPLWTTLRATAHQRKLGVSESEKQQHGLRVMFGVVLRQKTRQRQQRVTENLPLAASLLSLTASPASYRLTAFLIASLLLALLFTAPGTT